MSNRFVVLSGCSGGGKSTLLAELATRGYAVIQEPGRRIVQQEQDTGGTALPWIDGAAFAQRAIEMAHSDRRTASGLPGWIFFDRSLIDAASALQALTGEPFLHGLQARDLYHHTVFLAPPWPEIYVTDAERRHGFDESLAEFERLRAVYPALGYEVVMLPKVSVRDRADFVLAVLSTDAEPPTPPAP
jgi:predicted ATPase